MSRAIPTCDCLTHKAAKKKQIGRSQVTYQPVEIRFSEEAEGHVCIYCGRYPTWVPAEKSAAVDDWRAEFSNDLRNLLENWTEDYEKEESTGYAEYSFGKKDKETA